MNLGSTNGALGSVVFDSSVSGHAFTFGGLAGSPLNALALQDNAGNAVALTVGGNGENTTFHGALSAGGSLNKLGDGKLTLTGTNTYTGPTTVNAGTLQFANSNAIYGGVTSNWTAENLSVASGATVAFNVGGTNEFTSGSVSALLAGLSTVNNNGLKAGSSIGFDTTNAAGGTFTIADNISDSAGAGGGSVGLAKLGGNTLVLSGSNTYSGATAIAAGTLQFGKVSALYGGATSNWTAANLNIASGATVAFNVGGTNEFTAGNVSALLTGLSTVNNNGLKAGSSIGFDTTNAAGGTFTIANNISDSTGAGGGSVGLAKLGGNTLVLSGSNTYSGVTNVNAGTLNVSNQKALENSTLNMNGGNLVFDSSVSGHAFTLGGLVATSSSANIALQDNAGNAAALTVGNNNAHTNYAGDLSGSGSLIKTGSGTLFLSGVNTYTGTTTLSSGRLALEGAETVGTSGPLGQSAANNPGSIVLNGGWLVYTSLSTGTQPDATSPSGFSPVYANANDYSGRFSIAPNQQ